MHSSLQRDARQSDHLASRSARLDFAWSGAPVLRLQRKCACGGTPGPTGECEECRKKKLQRRPDNLSAPSTVNHQPSTASQVPPIVYEVLRSPGQPLDAATRAFFQPRFGHDFSQVRVHSDAKAAESAQAVNAQAFTVGRHIVFDRDEHRPATNKGRQLIAHELAHVVQQNGIVVEPTAFRISPDGDRAENEADAAAKHFDIGSGRPSLSSYLGARLRRKLKVDKPTHKIPNPGGKGVVQTNAETVKNYLANLCAGGSPTVDPTTGEIDIAKSFCTEGFLAKLGVAPGLPTPAAQSYLKTATGCGCICDIVQSANDWKIQVDDTKWPHTDFADDAAAKGTSGKLGGSGGVVTAPSPNSTKAWGAATASGKELDIDPWLVLGHELCGHAWLGNTGSAGPDETSPRGEGGHQETVARENELRKEHGIELRGTFKEPNCGESYWRDKGAPGKVNWSDFRKVCVAWRADYNKKNKTAFKITDTIP
jgi:Domain of unknown function (DUF4157)